MKSVFDKINSDEYKPKSDYNSDRQKWREEQRELFHEFKYDALAEVGLKEHPKAEKAYALAYERGHAHGYSEILSNLEELAELLLD